MIDETPPGGTLRPAAGVYAGPVTIKNAMTLDGQGSVVALEPNTGKVLAMVVQSVKIQAPPPGQQVDLTAFAAPGTGLQVTPEAGVAISLGGAGGGLVKVKASAKGRIIGVSIDDSLMNVSEKQMLEDLIAAAFNDARAKADAVSSEEMGKMKGSIPLPPGFKLPF